MNRKIRFSFVCGFLSCLCVMMEAQLPLTDASSDLSILRSFKSSRHKRKLQQQSEYERLAAVLEEQSPNLQKSFIENAGKILLGQKLKAADKKALGVFLKTVAADADLLSADKKAIDRFFKRGLSTGAKIGIGVGSAAAMTALIAMAVVVARSGISRVMSGALKAVAGSGTGAALGVPVGAPTGTESARSGAHEQAPDVRYPGGGADFMAGVGAGSSAGVESGVGSKAESSPVAVEEFYSDKAMTRTFEQPHAGATILAGDCLAASGVEFRESAATNVVRTSAMCAYVGHVGSMRGTERRVVATGKIYYVDEDAAAVRRHGEELEAVIADGSTFLTFVGATPMGHLKNPCSCGQEPCRYTATGPWVAKAAVRGFLEGRSLVECDKELNRYWQSSVFEHLLSGVQNFCVESTLVPLANNKPVFSEGCGGQAMVVSLKTDVAKKSLTVQNVGDTGAILLKSDSSHEIIGRSAHKNLLAGLQKVPFGYHTPGEPSMVSDTATVSYEGSDFCVMACDGFWDAFKDGTKDRAGTVLVNPLPVQDVYESILDAIANGQNPGQALADLARSEGSKDDITVVVIDLRSLREASLDAAGGASTAVAHAGSGLGIEGGFLAGAVRVDALGGGAGGVVGGGFGGGAGAGTGAGGSEAGARAGVGAHTGAGAGTGIGRGVATPIGNEIINSLEQVDLNIQNRMDGIGLVDFSTVERADLFPVFEGLDVSTSLSDTSVQRIVESALGSADIMSKDCCDNVTILAYDRHRMNKFSWLIGSAFLSDDPSHVDLMKKSRLKKSDQTVAYLGQIDKKRQDVGCVEVTSTQGVRAIVCDGSGGSTLAFYNTDYHTTQACTCGNDGCVWWPDAGKVVPCMVLRAIQKGLDLLEYNKVLNDPAYRAQQKYESICLVGGQAMVSSVAVNKNERGELEFEAQTIGDSGAVVLGETKWHVLTQSQHPALNHGTPKKTGYEDQDAFGVIFDDESLQVASAGQIRHCILRKNKGVFSSDHLFVIVACDGFWDMVARGLIKHDQAYTVITEAIKQNKNPSQSLAKLAELSGSTDDITVAVINLHSLREGLGTGGASAVVDSGAHAGVGSGVGAGAGAGSTVGAAIGDESLEAPVETRVAGNSSAGSVGVGEGSDSVVTGGAGTAAGASATDVDSTAVAGGNGAGNSQDWKNVATSLGLPMKEDAWNSMFFPPEPAQGAKRFYLGRSRCGWIQPNLELTALQDARGSKEVTFNWIRKESGVEKDIKHKLTVKEGGEIEWPKEFFDAWKKIHQKIPAARRSTQVSNDAGATAGAGSGAGSTVGAAEGVAGVGARQGTGEGSAEGSAGLGEEVAGGASGVGAGSAGSGAGAGAGAGGGADEIITLVRELGLPENTEELTKWMTEHPYVNPGATGYATDPELGVFLKQGTKLQFFHEGSSGGCPMLLVPNISAPTWKWQKDVLDFLKQIKDGRRTVML